MDPLSCDDRSTGPAGALSLAGLFERLEEPLALERELVRLALKTGPDAAAGAWLLVWDREPAALWVVSHDGPATAGPPARGPAALGARVDPERLDPIAAAAWSGPAPRTGASPGSDAPWAGAAALGAVTLRHGVERWGLLVVAWDSADDGTARARGLATLAHGGEVALAARDAMHTSRRATAQREALAAFARTGVSAAHLSEALHLAARLAAQATDSSGSALWLSEEDGALRLEVAHGPAGVRDSVARALLPIAAVCSGDRRPCVIDRALDDTRLSPECAARVGALALVPLAAYGRAVGVLAVFDPAPAPARAGGYRAGDVAFLSALADLAALVVDQAARFEALRAAEQQQRELRARLAREERAAARGEAARRAAHEARNPLASIAAFARRVHRALPGDDVQRESLEIVLREAERLERVLAGAAEDLPAEPPPLEVESLNQAVQQALQTLGETLVRRRVRLVKKLEPDLPALLVDPERVRRVVANLLAHALDEVSVGGRVRVESRRAGGFVQVDIAHDGPHPPGMLMDHLFVPFAAGPAGTADVGLEVAHRIIREHGGEIRVRSDGDWSTVVSFTMPIDGNQDRRRATEDRRRRHGDRRRTARGG